MRKLSEVEKTEIGLLLRKPKYAGSDRVRDRARTRLKSLGLITFDRRAWSWVVLPAGRAALEQEGR